MDEQRRRPGDDLEPGGSQYITGHSHPPAVRHQSLLLAGDSCAHQLAPFDPLDVGQGLSLWRAARRRGGGGNGVVCHLCRLADLSMGQRAAWCFSGHDGGDLRTPGYPAVHRGYGLTLDSGALPRLF